IGQPAIVHAAVLNPVNIQTFPVDKQIRLDIRVQDETGAMYDVEVQTEQHREFVNRMLYYWAESYSSQLQRHDGYSALQPVRSIIITEFPIFPKLKDLHTVFELRSRENPAVTMSGHLQIHFLRLGNMLKNQRRGLNQLCPGLQCWMNFLALGARLEENEMKRLLKESPHVQKAYEEYKMFSATPGMREMARERKRFIRDWRLSLAEARVEGEEIGEARGKVEGKIETARSALRKGIAVADIIDITGLSREAIEELQ
ncbi:MAG: Rpn family recombination-promoting nuclease/putative transposase, partial [Planctomycetaceae bacterium]|nr:Rpn family recombination-promoting nuclease/putative transposase [Planctomycetaceae bacterium]